MVDAGRKIVPTAEVLGPFTVTVADAGGGRPVPRSTSRPSPGTPPAGLTDSMLAGIGSKTTKPTLVPEATTPAASAVARSR